MSFLPLEELQYVRSNDACGYRARCMLHLHREALMLQLLLATSNPGKLHELVPLLGDMFLHIVTPHALGLHLDVEETGTTYAENARLKAAAFAHASGLLTLADDSGLEVDALSGAPGVYSARYAGEGGTLNCAPSADAVAGKGAPLNWRPSADAVAGNEASDADRRAKLIDVLRQVPAPRRARFRCVIAIASQAGQSIASKGY